MKFTTGRNWGSGLALQYATDYQAFWGVFFNDSLWRETSVEGLNVLMQDLTPKSFVFFLLGLAAINFLAAGMVTLATSVQIHVLFVSIAFVACGLGMYLLPRAVPVFSRPLDHVLSWGACLVMGGRNRFGRQPYPVWHRPSGFPR